MQIPQLLEAMKLEQYRDTFVQQEIDGQLLADSCDELVLEHDLKVSSKLHRARLLRVIRGQRSAVDILQGNSEEHTEHHSASDILQYDFGYHSAVAGLHGEEDSNRHCSPIESFHGSSDEDDAD